MSTLTPALPITSVTTLWPDLIVVSLFPLIGLTLSAMVLSRVSSETISTVLSLLG
jgi:hypothetical protein